MVSLWVLENAWCWQVHQKPITDFKNHSLKKGHSLRTASMCWSPPSAGSKRMQGGISHQGVVLCGSSEIFPIMTSSWDTMGGATLPQPSSCKAKQPHAPLVAILPRVKLPLKTGCGYPGLVFLGGKGTQRWGKWKRALHWVAFISGRYMFSETKFATFFCCCAPFCCKGGVRPGKRGCPSRKRSSGGEIGLGITQ